VMAAQMHVESDAIVKRCCIALSAAQLLDWLAGALQTNVHFLAVNKATNWR
jgi:hypothetical protein